MSRKHYLKVTEVVEEQIDEQLILALVLEAAESGILDKLDLQHVSSGDEAVQYHALGQHVGARNNTDFRR